MVRLRFDADMSGTLKATNDLAAAVEKVGKTLGNTAREAKKMEDAAKRIVDQNLTPQEKYNRQLEAMAKAVKAGSLSMADAEKTAARLRARLDETGNGARSVFTDVAKWAGGFTAADKALGFVVKGLQEAGQEAKQTADSIFNSLGAMGELQQLSPEKFQQNVGRARGLVRSGVFKEQGQAADLVFAMESAGYTDAEQNFIGQIGESKFVKPEGLQGIAEGLKKYQRTFGDKDAGSTREVFDKVIQASKTAQASVPETLKGLMETAPAGTQLGMTDEQTAAGWLAVEASSPNADLATTKYRSLLDQINKQKLWKGNMKDTLAGIDKKSHGGKDIFKVLGESRAVEAYDNISKNQPFMEEQQRLLESAPSRKLFESQSQLLGTDPILRASKLRSQAEGDADADQEMRVGEQQQLMEMIRARRFGKGSSGARWTEKQLFDAADAMQLDNLMLRNYGTDSALTGGNSLKPDERAAINDYLKRIAESNERMEKTTAAPGPSGRQE